jgi:hypothetical protein
MPIAKNCEVKLRRETIRENIKVCQQYLREIEERNY